MAYQFQTLQTLSNLASQPPVRVGSQLARAQTLQDLQNSQNAGVMQGQQIAAGQDAAKSRQAAVQADADVVRIMQGAKFDPDGTLDAQTEAALVQNASPHAQAILTNLSTVGVRKSTIQRDAALTQQGEQTRKTAEDVLSETRRHNQALESAPKPIDPLSAEGVAAKIQTSQGEYHAPVAPRNIDPNSQEGIAAATEKAKQAAKYKPEATVLVKTVDENGNPITQIIPKTAGTTIAGGPTAQEQNRRNQATTVINEADRIMAMIDANPNSVGPIMGRIARGEAVIGNVDPNTKALGTALGSFVALQPILHGFRGGGQTVDHFTQVLGDQRLNGAALKASLAQVKALAQDIKTGKVQTDDGKAGIVIDPSGVEHQVSDVDAAIKLHPGTKRK